MVSGTLCDDRPMQRWLRLWRWVLTVSCIAMVVSVLAVNRVLSGFHGLSLHIAPAIALVLGAICAIVLGVVLMGLLFYSERARGEASSD